MNQALAFAILMQASWYVPTTLAGGAILGWRALRMARDPSRSQKEVTAQPLACGINGRGVDARP